MAHKPHMNYASLVREIQKKTGENQSKLARRFRVSQPTVSRWLAGKDLEADHADRIKQEATRLGINQTRNNVTQIQIVGYVGAGGNVEFQSGQGPFGEAEMPPRGRVSPSIVAVKVRGDSMSGMLEDGWMVYYENRRDPPDETLYKKLCVVGLPDGRALVKTLLPGRKPGHYDLHSANAPVLLDQPVEWAARVSWIATS